MIADVVQQGALDAALEIGRCAGGIADLMAGEPELHLSDLDGIGPLDQRIGACAEAAGDGIGEGAELMEQGIGGGLGADHGLLAKDARPKASRDEVPRKEEAKLSKDKPKASPLQALLSLPITPLPTKAASVCWQQEAGAPHALRRRLQGGRPPVTTKRDPMHWLIDLSVGFLVLGLIEAVIKPIAKRFVQRRILQAAPLVFAQLDPYLPALLQECNGAQLEQIVRTKLETLTGESWAGEDLGLLFRLFDPRLAADRANPPAASINAAGPSLL